MVKLEFPKTDVREILWFYQKLTGRPVLVELDLQALVTIEPHKDIPQAEAIELIRKTLLESYGIEMRESVHGETLVRWSQDPKYPRRSDPPPTEAERTVVPIHPRARVIQPATDK